ncbi:hypothetical protein RF11_06225 [Thelohanellus kitauei]|uniref:Uncharacterized protein n=1 Tax=Thelohanellus kitauei TaxID=669202 RepID=A0A0C2IEJ2_THEKT|nr:hypothetical protein RF11_06225 [Thelohanellus kitauei]
MPHLSQIDACAKFSSIGGNEISVEALKKIFDNLFENRRMNLLHIENERAFQGYLFNEMTSRINNKLDLQANVITKRVEIIKKIIADRGLTDDNFFDVYCNFQNAVRITENVLIAAKKSYNDLNKLIEKLPGVDLEIDLATTKAVLIKKVLSQSIADLHTSEKIIRAVALREFIGKVLSIELDVDVVYDIIRLEITRLFEVLESYPNDHEMRKFVTHLIEEDHTFAMFLLKELIFLHDRLYGKTRMWFYMGIGFICLFYVVVIVIGVLKLFFLTRNRRYGVTNHELDFNPHLMRGISFHLT